MGRDRGSAVAEFALVVPVVLVTFLAVAQVAFAVHARDVLVAAAADGARCAAGDGHSPGDGVQRTRELIAESLPPAYSRDVRAWVVDLDGAPVVVVTVRSPLPVVGLAGPSGLLVVTAHALEEPR
jgi:TadE-like protein